MKKGIIKRDRPKKSNTGFAKIFSLMVYKDYEIYI